MAMQACLMENRGPRARSPRAQERLVEKALSPLHHRMMGPSTSLCFSMWYRAAEEALNQSPLTGILTL
jgi:hypothetical protein